MSCMPRACVCVFVCVCLGFSIVAGLGAGASIFPRYGVSVGGALAGLTATKSQSFPPDMQMIWGGRAQEPPRTAAFNAFGARPEVPDVGSSSPKKEQLELLINSLPLQLKCLTSRFRGHSSTKNLENCRLLTSVTPCPCSPPAQWRCLTALLATDAQESA